MQAQSMGGGKSSGQSSLVQIRKAIGIQIGAKITAKMQR